MKNKKKVPKTLGKFSLGGSTKFNESGFNVDNSTSQSDNIYNQKRGNKISANQYAAYGQAAMNMGTQLAANRELSGEERQYADNQTINNSVDSIAGNATPWYGMAKGLSNTGRSMIQRDENGVPVGNKNKQLDAVMKPQHQMAIEDITKGNTGLGIAEMLLPGIGYESRSNSLGLGKKINKMFGSNNYEEYQYPNGGMNMTPNAEIESQENVVAPNGGFLQADGPDHSNGGVPVALPGNSMIFSDRLKAPGTKKTFADLNKTNNTNKEDKILSSNKYGNISKHTAELMKFAKNKNSETLFNEQESLKQAKVQAYAKRMGVILPSNDNEQNELQDLSEQSEGEYAYGGIHNKLPMYPNGGESDTLGKKVVSVPSNYSFDRQVGNKKVFIDPGNINKAKKYNTIPQTNNNYNQFLIDKLKSGISPEELSKQGYGTLQGLKPLVNNYKPKYVHIEPFDTTELKKQVFSKPVTENYEQKIDRKEVFNSNINNPYIKYFDYPDANAGYSKSTRVAFDANSGTEVDPIKSFDAKGNYKPYFNLDTGRDYYKNTIKSEIPGTNPEAQNLNLNKSNDLRLESKQLNMFKYGGKMLPKYAYGDLTPEQQFVKAKFMGAEQNQRNLAFNQMTGNNNQQSSWLTPEAMQASSDAMVEDSYPSNNVSKSTAGDTEEEISLANDAIDRNHGFGKYSKNKYGKFSRNKKPEYDFSGLATNIAMGLANNAGNIYNLSRYNKPEIETYKRAKANLVDDSAAIRDANDEARRAEYNVRGASSGNAGTYLSNRVSLNAQNIVNKDRIRQQYANQNAQILNQNEQFNTDVDMREVIANAQNRARVRSGKGEAIGSMGYNTANQIMDNKKGNMDQETLNLMMKYYNNPEFQKYIKESKFKKK